MITGARHGFLTDYTDKLHQAEGRVSNVLCSHLTFLRMVPPAIRVSVFKIRVVLLAGTPSRSAGLWKLNGDVLGAWVSTLTPTLSLKGEGACRPSPDPLP
jgi:hypothetical protein